MAHGAARECSESTNYRHYGVKRENLIRLLSRFPRSQCACALYGIRYGRHGAFWSCLSRSHYFFAGVINARGLTGWGAKHTATFEEALKSTSLSPAQLQVYIYIGTNRSSCSINADTLDHPRPSPSFDLPTPAQLNGLAKWVG